MPRITAIPYRTDDHGSFEEEWGCHQRVSEWWYATGYFTAAEDRMYSYQFTLVRPHLFGLRPNVLMLALTDFATGRHTYAQQTALTSSDITIDRQGVQWGDTAQLVKGAQGMHFTGRHRDFALDLALDYGKGAVWHCDDGVLHMGLAAPKETTLYFSYTNMPTTGTLTLGDQTWPVRGKSWFDKQGGPFSLMNRLTHWEWFSLRFFDDEELMLFTFPQSGYQDGTTIPRAGGARRLTAYTVRPLDFVTVNGARFSTGWTLDAPGLKAEHYTIRPLMQGQLNLAYFEQLAGVYDPADQQVGLCFVELLPGVYNKVSPALLFKKVG